MKSNSSSEKFSRNFDHKELDWSVAIDYAQELGFGNESDRAIILQAIKRGEARKLRYLRKLNPKVMDGVCQRIPFELITPHPGMRGFWTMGALKVFRYETIREILKFLRLRLTVHSNSPPIKKKSVTRKRRSRK